MIGPVPGTAALRTALVAGALLTLTACSSTEPSSSPPPPAAPAAPAAQECAPDALAFGEPATVDYTGEDGTTSPLEITVTGVEQGDPADLAELELPEQPQGTPYYLTATVVNAGEEALQFADPAADLAGLDARCEPVTGLVIQTRFSACDYVTAPEGYAPGDEFETCVTYVVPDGGTLVGARYADPAGGGEPVTWTR